MIALPIYLQMVLEYNAMEAGLSIAPLSLTMFGVALLAGRKAGDRSPGRIILVDFALLAAGVAVLIPIVPRADSGWAMIPLVIAGAGLGRAVSQLNNYTLSPIEEERVSEAAGVNSAERVVRPLVRPRVRRGDHARLTGARVHARSGIERDPHARAAGAGRGRAGRERRGDDEHRLERLLEGQPPDVQDEILRINEDARPVALRIALLVPLVAALLGLLAAFGMTRLPDQEPSAAAETLLAG